MIVGDLKVPPNSTGEGEDRVRASLDQSTSEPDHQREKTARQIGPVSAMCLTDPIPDRS